MGFRADNAGQDYCTIAPWPQDWGVPFVDAMISPDNQTDMYDEYSSSCGPQADLRGERYNSVSLGTLRGVTRASPWHRRAYATPVSWK
jgi:hypothetical protein